MIPNFRIFDKQKKQMVESAWWEFYFEDERLLTVTSDLDVSYYDDELGERWELMQSTGLKDKNGKEIFEGDVLKSPYGFIGKVNIVEGAWYVQHNDFTNNHFLYVAQDKSEIIGNIHEHPGLLEKPNE